MRHLFAWIWVLLVFQFLDEILNFWPSNHFMCFNIVNTLIKGEIMWKSSWYEPWFDNDERLTKLLKWVWWHFGCHELCEQHCWNEFDGILGVHELCDLWMSLLLLCEFVSFMSLYASLLLLCKFVSCWWALWALYVSFTLVLVVLRFYLFLRCRRLIRALDLHVIDVEPFSCFSWGIMCLVLVVSSFCPCLWELRFFISGDLVLAFSLGFWISWMSFVFLLLLLLILF